MKQENITAYELIEKRFLEDFQSQAYVLKHKKTKARIIAMENTDENKVFYIGFRTTPKESTGVCHILEHSVLGGSKNFPVKDPFIELAKGSLNTFLNAMTYPDKTVYPVASCNDKDFQNLMHVYLDAVFYPNIYEHDKTFRQEGWHYEMESKEGPLTINGVVYNEMKGAFSSPDDVMEREILNSLFPDNAYGEESGGDPKKIPLLTYDHFLEIHRTYYHPSNSYIFLYGNMDMEEKLNFLDREYLSDFEYLNIDTEIENQIPFEKPREIKKEFSVASEEELKKNTYLSYNAAFEHNLNQEHYLAFQILDYALCSAPGAPLKQELLDAELGTDIYSFYDNGVKQPYFSIVAKNTEEDKKQEFVALVEETLEKLAKEGLDKRSLTAALTYYEFKYKEADFGSYPPGLVYGLQILDSWLYDEEKPFIHLQANETFALLREKINTDYYETLIKDFLLNNTHKSILTVVPKVGLTEEWEQQLEQRLEEYKQSLSQKEREQIVKDTKELIAYQEREDSPQALQCIPVLKREDLKKETSPLYNEKHEVAQRLVLYHPIFTNHISYFRIMFCANGISKEEISYLGLLKNILGYVDTKKYPYRELFHQIHIETGGMVPVINLYTNSKNMDEVNLYFEWKVKTFDYNLKGAFLLAKEVLINSLFEDEKRLKEILGELKSRMQSDMTSSGHLVAMGRAASYFSKTAALSEQLNALPLFQLVCQLEKNFQEKKEELKNNLQSLCDKIFRKENLMYDFTGSKESFEEFCLLAEEFAEEIKKEPMESEGFSLVLQKKNEGFTTAGQVQYVAMAGNYRKAGLEYTGALRMLKVILGYDYLWNRIRVKGGAYGCMSGFSKSGDSFFVSYRDPNLGKTIEQYREAAEYIRNFTPDERTLTQYLIGAISELDTPMTPQTKGLRSLSAYMTNQTEEDFQIERNQLLLAEGETIRSLADYLEAVISQENICVVGSAAKIKEESQYFKEIKALF